MRRRNWLQGPCFERRAVLGLALTPLLVGAARAGDAAADPPLLDDRFVFLTGPKKGQVVKVDDLALGGPQVQAYPVGADGTVRNKSLLNLVVLARFDPAELSEETRARAADGVVAYSGVCTHLGCPPNWLASEQKFKCPCHGSGFYISGINFEGPAPRPLERFRVALADDGQVMVDKSKRFQQELDQWSDADSFIPA